MIRRAQIGDAERLVEMGLRFASETEYARHVRVDPDRVAGVVVQVLSSPNGVVFVSGSDATLTGMIAMGLQEHPLSGERMATELVWWVEPEARGDGVRLLRAAEEWAREQGATRMQMVAPNERVAGLYRRVGYEQYETAYQRSL